MAKIERMWKQTCSELNLQTKSEISLEDANCGQVFYCVYSSKTYNQTYLESMQGSLQWQLLNGMCWEA